MWIRLWLNPQRMKKAMGVVRVLTYTTAVSLAFGAVTFGKAWASVGEESLKAGRELEGLTDLIKGATELRLNGQPVYLSTNTSTDPVDRVLDRFEAHCNADPAFKEMEWKELGNLEGRAAEVKKKTGMNSLGIIRKEDKKHDDGVVLCFRRDDKSRTNFLDAVRVFGETGDLHDLGKMRYVHVSRGKSGKTMIEAVWTDGHFSVHDIMGSDNKDAIGTDSAEMPRPDNSVRRFTAEAVGTPYTARIYETGDSPDQALASYDAKMDKKGWLILDSPYNVDGTAKGHYYTYLGKQSMVAVREVGSKTQVIVGEMGATEKAPEARVTQ